MSSESISAKLRRWADESESADFVTCHPMTRALDECGLIDSLGGYVQERELFRRIADEIDREIDELRELVNPGGQPIGESIREIATGEDKYPWGDSKYPLLKRALDRYYLPRPLFEDGEPVEVGDSVELNGYTREVTGLHVSCDGKVIMNMKDGSSLTFDGEIPLFKRPKQPVLDADGVPIEVGDKVWTLPGEHCETFPLYGYKAGVEYTVTENENARHKESRRICITGGDCIYGYPMPEQVTHREPDSQERIDRDALKSYYEYWVCDGVCSRCPARIDDKKPHERYDTSPSCTSAMTIDLLRRQRELDGRDA